MTTNKQIVLINRPKTYIDPDVHSGKGTFLLKEAPVEDVKDGQFLLRAEYISVDPAMRGWLNDSRSYAEPIAINAVMRALGVGKVVAVGSGVTDVQVGDYVSSFNIGLQLYRVVTSGKEPYFKLTIPEGVSPSYYTGVLGMPGLTAYFGITRIGKIKPGETVVVSGAAGAVGYTAVHLAKILGAGKVVAIAGGPEKTKFLAENSPADVILDYKSPQFAKEFEEKVGYLDVYYDNVGGDILDLALTRLNKFARIIACGSISRYNDPDAPGLKNYAHVIMQSATWEGFIVSNYAADFSEGFQKLGGWLLEGKLKSHETFIKGLENAPKALAGLFKGENIGKMVVDVREG